jgi:hypothetical protein
MNKMLGLLWKKLDRQILQNSTVLSQEVRCPGKQLSAFGFRFFFCIILQWKLQPGILLYKRDCLMR